MNSSNQIKLWHQKTCYMDVNERGFGSQDYSNFTKVFDEMPKNFRDELTNEEMSDGKKNSRRAK